MQVSQAQLDEVARELDITRGDAGRWFGAFSGRPMQLTNHQVHALARAGLLQVLEWDEGPADGSLRTVIDRSSDTCIRAVRTRTLPTRACLSTDGWAILVG